MRNRRSVFIEIEQMDDFRRNIKPHFLFIFNPRQTLGFGDCQEWMFAKFVVDVAFPAECFNDIDLDLDDAKFPTFDVETARAELASLGITSMAKRVLELAGGAAAAPAATSLAIPPVVSGDDALAAFDGAVASGAWLAATVDDDRPADALFGLGHTLWVATADALLRIDDDAADQAIVRQRINKIVFHVFFPSPAVPELKFNVVHCTDVITLYHEIITL